MKRTCYCPAVKVNTEKSRFVCLLLFSSKNPGKSKFVCLLLSSSKNPDKKQIGVFVTVQQ